MSYVKRAKEIRNFSNEVNNAIEFIRNNKTGKYSRSLLNVSSIYDVVNFIDNNLFIKDQLGKSIRLLTKFNDDIEGIEIYDCYDLQAKIDKSLDDFYL